MNFINFQLCVFWSYRFIQVKLSNWPVNWLLLFQGLWLEINLKNGDVSVTQRTLDAMKKSDNARVIDFLKAFEGRDH